MRENGAVDTALVIYFASAICVKVIPKIIPKIIPKDPKDTAMHKYYIKKAIENEIRRKKYIEKISYYDFNSERIEFNYSLVDKYKKDYYFLKSIFNYFSNEYKDYHKIFITITLPSAFHSPSAPNDPVIYLGAKKINNFFRKYLRYVSSNFKLDYKYVKVFEYHKDFTPHAHIVLYVEKSDKYTFAYLKNLFYRYKKKENIGRCQFKLLQGDKGVQKYISKYIAKTFNYDIRTLYILDGWKRENNIRLITYSKLPLPKRAFKVFMKNCDLSYQDIKNKGYEDFYQYALDNVELIYVFKKKRYYSDVLKSYVRYRGKESRYQIYFYYEEATSYRGFIPFIREDKVYNYFYQNQKDNRIEGIISDLGMSKEDFLREIVIRIGNNEKRVLIFDKEKFEKVLEDYYISCYDYLRPYRYLVFKDGELIDDNFSYFYEIDYLEDIEYPKYYKYLI